MIKIIKRFLKWINSLSEVRCDYCESKIDSLPEMIDQDCYYTCSKCGKVTSDLYGI